MKPKTVRQTKKASVAVETARERSIPGDDEIRGKALEIYFERISRGEAGTAEDDWRVAKELLMG